MTVIRRNHAKKVPARGKGNPAIGLVVGGAFGAVANLERVLGVDLVVRIDAASEIATTGDGPLNITLAQGETVSTINEQAPFDRPVQVYLEEHQGIDLDKGMGQSPLIGGAAAQIWLASPQAESILTTQVIEPVQMIHNGTVDTFTLVCMGGLSGGTAPRVARMFADSLAKLVLEQTGAIAHIQLIRVGSASYISLGRLVHLNAAITVAKDMDYVTSSQRHKRETRSLVLFELPICSDRKDERDRFAAQFAQAFLTPAVRKHLDLVLPNSAFSSRYGCVSIVNPRWYPGLTEDRVAAEVAAQYRPQFEVLARTQPNYNMVDRVECRFPWDQIRPALSLQELLDPSRRARQPHQASLEDECRKVVGPQNSPQVLIQLWDGTRVDVLERLRIALPPTYDNVAAFERRLAILLTMRWRLDQELERVAGERGLADRSAKRSHLAFEKTRRSFEPQNFLDRLTSVWRRPKDRARSFQNAIVASQGNACRQARYGIEYEAISHARQLVDQECSIELGLLHRTVRRMDEFPLGRDNQGNEPLLIAAPLDHIFRSLMTLAAREEDDLPSLLRQLLLAVAHVTMTGLARVVKAPQARAETIVDLVANNTPPFEAPFWGCARPSRKGTNVLVLPPLHPHIETEIRRAIGNLDPTKLVFCARVADAGVNAVDFEIIKPELHEEIVTPPVGSHLKSARLMPEIFGKDSADYENENENETTASTPMPSPNGTTN